MAKRLRKFYIMYKPLLTILFLLVGYSLFSQKLKTNLFQNANIKGKVLELKIAPEYKNAEFIVGLGKNQKIIANTEFTSTENNIVDLRQFDVPNHIDFIATTLPTEAIIRKRLIKPTTSQELAILFSKYKITLRAVNLITPKTLLGYRYTLVVLLLVFGCFLGLHFGMKQPYIKAALVSSLIGFVLIDLTTMNDHLTSIQDAEKKYPKIVPVIDVTADFVEEASPIIAGNRVVTMENLPNFYQPILMKYHLAEEKHSLKKKAKKLPKGTFIITSKQPNKKQKLILSINGINLLRKQ